jgi:hypothetical protein
MYQQNLRPTPSTLKSRLAQPYWPEVLTDWCVIRALAAAGWPQPLGSHGGAQAAFVSEVSAYLRFRALDLREAEAEARVLAAIETVYRRAGGMEYAVAKETMEATQTGFLIAHARATCEAEPPSRLADELRRCEWQLDRFRHPVADQARLAGRAIAETYWRAVAACRVPEGFFANVPAGSAVAHMRARFDLWWMLFLRSLRSILRETNPSYCRLLQALPALREASIRPGQKFVLGALVRDWRESNAERFGLLKDIHFPVLEQRSFAKFETVNAWFDHHARGYRHDEGVREAAVRALYDGLERVLSEPHEVRWDN